MKKSTILFLLLVTMGDSYGQTHQLGGQFNPGLAFYTFTKDSLVSDRKRGETGSGSLVEYGLEYTYTAKNKLVLRSGIGISNHFINIKGGNSFRVFLGRDEFWYLINNRDSFNLLKTEHTLKTLTIPTAIGYSVPIGRSRRGNLEVGIELQHHFLLKSFTKVTADTAFRIPTANDLEWIEKRFNDRANKYMLSFRPVIDFHFFISDEVRLKISALPLKKYIISWYENINTRPFILQFRMAVQVKL